MTNIDDINDTSYPVEVATTLSDLMRFEWLVQSRKLLPSHPVYSILAGKHASKLRGRGLDFEEVRQYIPGDDIRNIDWIVTARTGETHSKVFTEEKERPSFIIVDQSSWMFFGSTRFVKSVSAAHAAALAAFYTLKRGDRTGGLIFNEEGIDFIAPRRNKSSLQHFLQCIVNKNAQLPNRKEIHPNTPLLNNALKKASAAITHDYVVSVISDFSMIDQETMELLQNMSYHNDVILIHIYDEQEETLPDGKLVLTDGRKQITWNNRKHHHAADYKKNFSEMKKKLTEDFRHTRIPVVFFHTSIPVEEQVIRDMGLLRT